MDQYSRMSRAQSLRRCLWVYIAALIGAGLTVRALPNATPVVSAAVADLVATLIVFLFGRVARNSSLYDPYWSLAPPILMVFWFLSFSPVIPAGATLWESLTAAATMRALIVGVLVFVWGIRLTANWIRRWQGLGDEDWRYSRLKNRAGSAAWLIDLFGIHLFPTAQVFVASISICLVARGVGLSAGIAVGLTVIDAIALLVTAGAIVLETVADRQLSDHRNRGGGTILDTGVWRNIRHPNYLGEILFWWGLWLFAISAVPATWWSIIGPLTMTALFVFISVPMMDRHLAERYPGYSDRKNSTAALVPRVY